MAVANTCECCESCAIASDDFTTDKLADDYTTDSGTWAVSTGKLSATSANALIRHNTVIPTGVTAIHCQVTITCTSTSDSGELVFACADANNYWYASVTPGAADGGLKIVEVSGGLATQRGVGKKITGFAAGDTITLAVCYTAGLVTAQAGGDAIRCYPATLSVEGTYCGLKTGSGSSSVIFDDFTVSRHSSSGSGTCPACNSCTYETDLCSICEEEVGEWPTNWPSNIYFTISGSCCAALNRTWMVPRNTFATDPYYDSSFTTSYQVTGCGGRNFGTLGYASRVELRCLNGTWTATLTLSAGASDPTIPNCAVPLTLSLPSLLSCDPLHLTGTGQTFDTGPCAQPRIDEFSCAGSFSYEITE